MSKTTVGAFMSPGANWYDGKMYTGDAPLVEYKARDLSPEAEKKQENMSKRDTQALIERMKEKGAFMLPEGGRKRRKTGKKSKRKSRKTRRR